MGALFVVSDEPVSGHAADLVEGFEHVAVEHLVAVGAIEAFDVGVLVWLAGLDEEQPDAMLPGPALEVGADELRAVVHS